MSVLDLISKRDNPQRGAAGPTMADLRVVDPAGGLVPFQPGPCACCGVHKLKPTCDACGAGIIWSKQEQPSAASPSTTCASCGEPASPVPTPLCDRCRPSFDVLSA